MDEVIYEDIADIHLKPKEEYCHTRRTNWRTVLIMVLCIILLMSIVVAEAVYISVRQSEVKALDNELQRLQSELNATF